MCYNGSRSMLWSLLILVVAISVGSVPNQQAYGDDAIKITPDVVYGHKNGLALTFDVLRPEKNPNGAGVLWMVSGGWHSGWEPAVKKLPFFKPLTQKGFTVFIVRHGSSPKFIIPEIAEDVRRSVRFIRLNAERFGVDPERLGVYGGSAGGHLSLLLGTTSDDGNSADKDPVLRESDRVAAVVALCPPTDLRSFVSPESFYYKTFPALRFDPAEAVKFSPVANVSKDDPPTLLIHGDKDTLVKIDHSLKILKEFQDKGVNCKLITIEGGGHGFKKEDHQLATKEMVVWFEKFLNNIKKD
jgi:acetyl esterase/lipase